jgi:hypothetical protein
LARAPKTDAADFVTIVIARPCLRSIASGTIAGHSRANTCGLPEECLQASRIRLDLVPFPTVAGAVLVFVEPVFDLDGFFRMGAYLGSLRKLG